MGLLMLQDIINRLRENKENKTKEHVKSDDEIIINNYEFDPPTYNIIKEEVTSTGNDE